MSNLNFKKPIDELIADYLDKNPKALGKESRE